MPTRPVDEHALTPSYDGDEDLVAVSRPRRGHQSALHYSMGIPGTFEVHDKDGYWKGTSAEFKSAEALADHLNAVDPDGGYDWSVVR